MVPRALSCTCARFADRSPRSIPRTGLLLVTPQRMAFEDVFARRDGTVAPIDIYFDSNLATEFFQVVHRQFDNAGFWGKGDPICAGPMTIIGNVSPQHPNPDAAPVTVERVCETLTTKYYSVSMTNYDIIFAHVTAPMYRGSLEMKLADQEL